jgi:hypothetical protein
MSLSFRPVNEIWGEHSSCFVNGDLTLWVLLTIAAEAGTHSEAYEYGDKTSFWVEDGGKFLDFISSEPFTAERIAKSLGLRAARHLSDLKFLVSNMQLCPWNTLFRISRARTAAATSSPKGSTTPAPKPPEYTRTTAPTSSTTISTWTTMKKPSTHH